MKELDQFPALFRICDGPSFMIDTELAKPKGYFTEVSHTSSTSCGGFDWIFGCLVLLAHTSLGRGETRCKENIGTFTAT